MSPRTKVAVGDVAVGLILLRILPARLALLIMVSVPAAACFTLDTSQRRRPHRVNRRRIGR